MYFGVFMLLSTNLYTKNLNQKSKFYFGYFFHRVDNKINYLNTVKTVGRYTTVVEKKSKNQFVICFFTR